MVIFSSRSVISRLLVFVALLSVSVAPLSAQTTWSTTATSGEMTNTNNWLDNSAPLSGDAWFFTNSSTLILTNSFTDYSVSGITFTAAGNNYSLRGNAFTLTGDITNASTSQVTISNNLTVNSAILITNTTTGYVTLGGSWTGSGTITYGAASSSGRLVLQSGSHSGFSGALIANSGRVNIGANQSSASADYTFNNSGGTFLTTFNTIYNFGSLSGSGTISANGNPFSNTLVIGAKGSSTVFSGNISSNFSGTNSLIKVGAGTLTLSGANTYKGTTTISNGVLQIGEGGTDGSISNTTSISLAGGSLAINRSDVVTQGVDFTGTALAGAGGFIQVGAGTTTLTSANTYTGDTVVSGGALLLSNASAIESSALNMAGGSLLFDGTLTAVTAGGLNGTGGLVLTNNNGDAVTLTLSNAASTAVSDTTTISGTGGLVLSGTGTQTLSGASTFSGGLVLNAGANLEWEPTIRRSPAVRLRRVRWVQVRSPSMVAPSSAIQRNGWFGQHDDQRELRGQLWRSRWSQRRVASLRRDRYDRRRENSFSGALFQWRCRALSSANASLYFVVATGGPATSFTNGTLRLVRDASGGTGDYVSVRFDFNTGTFYGDRASPSAAMSSPLWDRASFSTPLVRVRRWGWRLEDTSTCLTSPMRAMLPSRP